MSNSCSKENYSTSPHLTSPHLTAEAEAEAEVKNTKEATEAASKLLRGA